MIFFFVEAMSILHPRVNLLIACWGGKRRTPDPLYEKDFSYYLKLQAQTLSRYGDCLAQVTFVSNGGQEPYLSFLRNSPWESWIKAPVKVLERQNVGYSNGAWLAGYQLFPDFDYYIFLEDDYVFVCKNFVQCMIEIYESLSSCGYLCSLAQAETPTVDYPTITRFPAILNGIISSQVLKEFNPASIGANSTMYVEAEHNGQWHWGFELKKRGFEVYDMGSRYKAPFIDQDGSLKWYYGNAPDFLVVPAQLYPSIQNLIWERMSDQEWAWFRQKYLLTYNVFLPDSERWKYESKIRTG